MSKYATLPDIDTGADVFETPDVAPQPSYSLDSDSDSDSPSAPLSTSPTQSRRYPTTRSLNTTTTTAGGPLAPPPPNSINHDRINASDARDRFGQVERDQFLLAVRDRDEPTRPGRRRRLPPTHEYTSSHDRDAETRVERLRRLRHEILELEDEVRHDLRDTREDVDDDDGNDGNDGAKREAERSNKEDQVDDDEGTTKKREDEGNDGVTRAASRTHSKRRQVTPAVILQQLEMMRADLTSLDHKLAPPAKAGRLDEPSTYTTTTRGPGRGRFEAKASSTSEHLVRELEARRGQDDVRQETKTDQTAYRDDQGGGGAGQHDVGETSRTAQFEKRLCELERLVGANEADVDESRPVPVPLVATLTRLDHLVTLLTHPRHLDSISRRVKVVVSDLERIHESRRKLGDSRPLNVAVGGGIMSLSTGNSTQQQTLTTTTTTTTMGGTGGGTSSPSMTGPPGAGPSAETTTTIPPSALQKIDSLFSLVSRIDPLVPLAPRLLTRLRSLSTLHSHAASFSTTLSHLELEVKELSTRQQGQVDVVDKLDESFKTNQDVLKGNLVALEDRLKDVAKRLDKLET
ncbi:hypothetical protein JCM10212_000321 [Sporobolomyces blumeae]